MANLTLSNLVRTMQSYFRFGALRLKDSSGVLEIKNGGDSAYAPVKPTMVYFMGANAAHYVSLTAPSGLGADPAFVLPSADGATGQFMKTDGSGNLSFASAAAYAQQVFDADFTQASDNPLTLMTPSANATITCVQVDVTSAAAGGAPTMSIGISGDADRDMDETEIDLLTAGVYTVYPNTDVTGSPAAMIATFVVDSQTFGGTIRIWHSTVE